MAHIRNASSSSLSGLPAAFTVPPTPPRIHRKVRLRLLDKGLLLAGDNSGSGLVIRWGVKGEIENASAGSEKDDDLIIGGILGIVRLWDAAYLIIFLPSSTPPTPLFAGHEAPADRQALASGYNVHTLSSVRAIPLVPDLAKRTLAKLRKSQTRRKGFKWKIPISGAGTAPRADPDESQGLINDAGSATSDVEDDKEEREDREERETEDDDTRPTTPAPPVGGDEWTQKKPLRKDLEGKIVAQIVRELDYGAFFYSYDFDLTRTLQHKRHSLASKANSKNALAALLPNEPLSPPEQQEELSDDVEDDFIEPNVRLPLWRRVDRRFFWNENLLKDFIDAGHHDFILPVMQGWVQTSNFKIPIPPSRLEPNKSLGNVPVDLVVISRRSRDRAGLRYQRRGIDDEGHVANFVETEMIVRAKVEGKVSLFSFTQVRGSIPLKWSQSPYSMKPPPVLDMPIDQTYSIAKLHFDDLVKRYGPINIINLGEQHGKEADVTNGYKELVESLDRDDLKYKDFDFHAKCKGMKWENISELVDELNLDKMGYFWTLQGEVVREQAGVFRTNCIDCLDRTNVVQSAIARRVLSNVLLQLGILIDSQEVESVFNDVWANNGDTISMCYAHTSALKGDFVRTGKRDINGMLHDGVSSLSRMFYGAVSDFFAQAVISFMLGHRSLVVFNEFLETLSSNDASNLIKLSRIRSAAIETSSARVLNEGELRVAGWTLLSPEGRSTKISAKMEEKILLLTKQAIYVVSFNYSLEKVMEFTRIPLTSVISIHKGAYILSTLQEASRDPSENAGFVLIFSPADESTRYSTYSLRNKLGAEQAKTEFYAFKVLPREFVSDTYDSDDESNDKETCRQIADRIAKRISEIGKIEVLDGDVVSLAEAQNATSIVAKLDYAFKRFLWL